MVPRKLNQVSIRWLLMFLVSLTIVSSLFSLQIVSAQTTLDCAPTNSTTIATPAFSDGTPAASPVEFPENGGELTVFAAASLTDAFNTMAQDLEAAHPGLKMTFNFAGSQQLVTQLTEGATADVFASADEVQMQAAVDAGVIDGSSTIFAGNHLVLIAPKNNPANLTVVTDLANDGVKLVLAAPAVPVGAYSRTAICNMSEQPDIYGTDFAEKVAANIVSEENNVKAVLAKIQLGEADAGIVYSTDVSKAIADEVVVIGIPDDVNIMATYPIAVVANGNADAAQAFIDYVLGPEGQATLQEFGFQPPPR